MDEQAIATEDLRVFRNATMQMIDKLAEDLEETLRAVGDKMLQDTPEASFQRGRALAIASTLSNLDEFLLRIGSEVASDTQQLFVMLFELQRLPAPGPITETRHSPSKSQGESQASQCQWSNQLGFYAGYAIVTTAVSEVVASVIHRISDRNTGSSFINGGGFTALMTRYGFGES